MTTAPMLTDKELWENGCLSRWQLEHWTDDDLARHSAGVRKTIQFLLARLDGAITAGKLGT